MIPGLMADKTLSVNLKELEADELIIRKEYPRIPPRVEYCFSERGRSRWLCRINYVYGGIKQTVNYS